MIRRHMSMNPTTNGTLLYPHACVKERLFFGFRCEIVDFRSNQLVFQ